MAKNKKSIIPHYEMLYIVSNQFTEDELKPIVQKVNKLIEDKGGKITYSEAWGKKKFAYPIKNFNHGYYNLVEFDLEGRLLQELNTIFRMDSEILRHTIVARKVRTLEEIKEEKKKSEEIAIQSMPKEKIEKVEKVEKMEVKIETPKEKVNLKDLDEKLDKILETDDLL
jgi:small subunit ribosomal protein S6